MNTRTPAAGRLILGGHTFFSSWSNEGRLTPAEHVDLVEQCLDSGITTFDTTYQGERLALGEALRRCGRRNEATIICWNFLDKLEGPESSHDPKKDRPRLCTQDTLNQWLTELQTDSLDWVSSRKMCASPCCRLTGAANCRSVFTCWTMERLSKSSSNSACARSGSHKGRLSVLAPGSASSLRASSLIEPSRTNHAPYISLTLLAMLLRCFFSTVPNSGTTPLHVSAQILLSASW